MARTNSAALIKFPETRADAVRPGIMLYGCSPFPDRPADTLGLKPAMTLTSEIIGVQNLQPGERVGYGFTYEAAQEMARSLRRVVSTLLHTPTVRMKELASDPDGARYATALHRLFDLDPGDMPTTEELLGRANEALTQISLQSSLEANRLAEENRRTRATLERIADGLAARPAVPPPAAPSSDRTGA